MVIDETAREIEYVTVAEAARRLGVNGHAVRQRIYRGSLTARRDGKTLLVGLAPVGETETARTTARETTRKTARVPSDEMSPNDAEILFLRERLAARDTEIRDMRAGYERQISELHILLQTAQRQLPANSAQRAPADPRESSVRPAAQSTPYEDRSEANASPGGVREESDPSQRSRPSWWRRFFLGEG